MIFVTHDLEEAIAMADKVYVLTAGPATVKSVYTIDLPRPRVTAEIRYEPAFVEYARLIWNDLREEVQKSHNQASGRSSSLREACRPFSARLSIRPPR